MTKYELEISTSAERELHKFSEKLQDRFINKIYSLGKNPRPFGSKKLFASDSYRIRIGNYRVVYSINDAKKTVVILDIGHRKDIYR